MRLAGRAGNATRMRLAVKHQLVVPAPIHGDGDQPVLLGVDGQLHRLLPAVSRLTDTVKKAPACPVSATDVLIRTPSSPLVSVGYETLTINAMMPMTTSSSMRVMPDSVKRLSG